MILLWFLFVLTFALGYLLGFLTHRPEKVTDIINDSGKILKVLAPKKTGFINRTTAEELRKKGTVDEAGEQAMVETLNEVLK